MGRGEDWPKYLHAASFALLLTCGCNDANFAGSADKKEAALFAAGPFTEDLQVKGKASNDSSGKADLILLLDSSDSMADERGKLSGNLAGFMGKLSDPALGLDYQVIVIGTDFVFPQTAQGKVEFLQQKVDSHDALAVLQTFLMSPPQGAISLRSDAAKEVIVVTDDNASMAPRDFEAWANQQAAHIGKVRINGFVGTDESRQAASCKIAAPGSTYIRLQTSPTVGGLIQDICSDDWERMLGALADRIISHRSATELTLSKPIRKGALVKVILNGTPIDATHVSINSDRNSILLDGTIVAKPGDKVRVTYDTI
jgi:hypothetical protein